MSAGAASSINAPISEGGASSINAPVSEGGASSINAPVSEGGASSIAAMERRRRKLGLSHARLCALAFVRPDAWREIRRGKRKPAPITIARLQRALVEASAGKTLATVRSFYRLTALLIAEMRGVAISAETLFDFSAERPHVPEWLAMARTRMIAIYTITVEYEIGNAELARAIGCTRQNIKQVRRTVEDWREAQPDVAKLIARLAGLLHE